MEQLGEAWLEWRAGGIGGSDVAGIMGVSPWVTRPQLLRQKIKNWKCVARQGDSRKSPAMMRGTRLEPKIRDLFNQRSGRSLVPACGIHDVLRFMRSSFDGLDETGRVALEIKCPNINDHTTALEKAVPEKYWPQCQHNLYVAGADKLYYVSWSDNPRLAPDDQLAVVVVRPSDSYVQAMVEAETLFWAEVEEGRFKARQKDSEKKS